MYKEYIWDYCLGFTPIGSRSRSMTFMIYGEVPMFDFLYYIPSQNYKLKTSNIYFSVYFMICGKVLM